jgi:hypothetical protein
VAGGAGARADALHERAKLINQAYAVLRDRDQRWLYDRSRVSPFAGGVATAPRVERRRAATATVTATAAPPPPRPVMVVDEEPPTLWAPLRALASAYYLLPGPYEWEPGSDRELLAAFLILPLGLATWLLLTGRLNAVLDQIPFGVIAACGGLLLCTLLAGRDLPRIVLAAAPSVLQFSGVLDGLLGSAHLPTWVAMGSFALISVLVSARLYVFAVLPTLGVCWALSHVI